jgi:uncharacterized membrane protein
MNSTRLEAFSDAVIAIIMTIMVLELKIPHGVDFAAIWPLWPVFSAYVLSFVYLAIYWNNHHHLLHATDHVDGRVLWANMFLLFWLSLIPFVTGWMAENSFAHLPTAVYGAVLLMAAVGYFLLQTMITMHHDANQALRDVLGRDLKGKGSMLLYLVAIPLAFFHEWIAIAIYILVGLIWLVPDRRIEKKLGHRHS